MRVHLLDKNCSANLCVSEEDMKNISKCGKEIAEWAITTLKREVTCRLCLKSLEDEYV